MNIKRWSWSDWLAVLLAGSIIFFIFLVHRGDSVRAKSKKIQVGMPRSEVKAILCKPTNSPEDQRSWVWKDDDGVYIVGFDGSGKVTLKQYNRGGTFMAKVRELVGAILD